MEKDQEVSLYRAAHHMRHGGLQKALKLKEGTPITKEHIKKAQGSDNPHVKLLGHLMDAKQAMDMSPDPQGGTKAMEKDLGYK